MAGRFSQGVTGSVEKLAIPVLLGDYYKQYRVVGTTTAMFDDLEYRPEEHKKYELAQGRNFKLYTPENGFFEAVVGATVAREYQLQLGDKLVASHGAAAGEASHEHGESPFVVVGILKPSGTPMDRAVFVNMEGFYLMSGHAKVVEEEDKLASEPEPLPDDGAAAPPDPNEAHRAARRKFKMQPLALDEREVTAILYRIDDFAAMAYTNEINEGSVAQGVQPIAEIYTLLDMIVKPIQTLLLAITMLICVVSGVSILVSIYNSMNERKHEIAVMRALGAGRSTVMFIVLLESIFLSLGGGVLGWLIGHGVVFAARGYVEQLTGVSLGPFELAPASPEVLTMLFTVFAWLAIVGGSVMLVVALIGFLFAMWRKADARGGWQRARGWLMAMIFALALRFIGVAFYYLSGVGAFVPLGEVIPPELVLVPGLVLLAVLVGFLPAITAYRTDVAKSLQA
jgi:putative ABC transport system permease protein